jgi:3-oxoisoapionate kinase
VTDAPPRLPPLPSGIAPPWLTFYADDFTGATDALERLELAGVRTALFMDPPTAEVLARHPAARAIGVAGVTRSLPVDQIEATVRPALEALRDLGADHVHYKVCSTFDSSPQTGSIGRVIDIARAVFAAPFTPVVVGAPDLGRWCVFGNLFAGMGIGADSPAYRLDRHPSMRNHPVTPADEADLRIHLGRQTARRIGLIDVRTLSRSTADVAGAMRELVASQECEIVLFDTLEQHHLTAIGRLLAPCGTPDQPLFWVGSSAVESALAAQWQTSGQIATQQAPSPFEFVGPVLVTAGSCSPVTEQQIQRAVQDGWCLVSLPPAALSDAAWQGTVHRAATEVIAALDRGLGVVVSTRPAQQRAPLAAGRLGAAFAALILECLTKVRPDLLVVAGGDTASYTARSLGIDSLEFVAPLTPGAPVCRAASANPLVAGLQVVFKGGQVGRPEFLADLMQPVDSRA